MLNRKSNVRDASGPGLIGPAASVILPVRNEEKFIDACLCSLLRQQTGTDRVEILIVDGMSEDKSRTLLEAYAGKHSQIRIIDNVEKTVTAALRLGIEHATGQYIIRADAHALYAPDYLTKCLEIARKTGAANVGGHMTAIPSANTLVAKAIVLAHYSFFGLGGAGFHSLSAEGEADTVWLGCYRSDVLDQVGYVNKWLPRSEDIELNARIRKAGYKIVLSPEIRAWYFPRATLGAVVRQKFADGAGAIHAVLFTRSAIGMRHLAPLLSLFTGTLLAGLGFRAHSKRVRLCAVGVLAFLVSAYAILSGRAVHQANRMPDIPIPEEGLGAKKREAAALVRTASFLLPVVCPLLHFSQAVGALWGLLSMPDLARRVRRGAE